MLMHTWHTAGKEEEVGATGTTTTCGQEAAEA
jgi:hypothetical protein